jgi:serine/tyrosine/threonine adenylyltransferase
MRAEPQDAPYRPDAAISAISGWIGDVVSPADFPQATVRYRNTRWDGAVGLGGLTEAQWIGHFARFQPLPENLPAPLALRYHGHQFRHYNPDLGDGRGFLFAQLRDGTNRLLDLGTKGSGRTPWSRTADGRLTLKGAVREILATEMLEALGVNTSKTFSVIETGEQLVRGDEPSPTRSAVLVRLSHSHIRIGSFQRLAYLGETEHLAALVDYALAQYPGPLPPADAPHGDLPPVRLLHQAVERMADLAASYMVAGFVHGVLNTDNIAITGESFDYGPWRFLPHWDPAFTAAYFDEHGLYSFGRQPEAIRWNLAQLAIALRPLVEPEGLIAALDRYGECYQASMTRRFCWRLGVASQGMEADTALIELAEHTMREEKIGPHTYFHRQRGGSGEPESLLIEEVEAIWAAIAEQDDWTLLNDKVTRIRQLGRDLGEPPVPSGHLPTPD